MKKTIGELIDSLSITNCKIFSLEDLKRNPTASDKDIAEATRKTNKLNSLRNVLVDEIDLAFNEIAEGKKQQLFGSNKQYGK